jgi:hypothetical protein
MPKIEEFYHNLTSIKENREMKNAKKEKSHHV